MTVMELSNGFTAMEADELYFINGGKVAIPEPGEIKEIKDEKETKENKVKEFLEKTKEVIEKVDKILANDNIKWHIGTDGIWFEERD